MRTLWATGLLAVLAATARGAENSAPARQLAQEFETTIKQKITMKYLLYLPPDYGQKEACPLLVFLHGAGERGDDLDQVKVHGPPKLIEQGKDFPFIVVSPQCPSRQWWQPDAIAHLIDEICEKHKVDRQRIYLTGLSMGGYGTWATVAAHPRLLAAIVPICGGGDPGLVERHKHVPTWVFHGAKDEVVPLKNSQEMVDALQAAGAEVKFTIDPEAGHDSWTKAYENPALYDWLLQHKRAEN
jgi:predicted peptidase